MILKLAELFGVPTWAVKMLLAVGVALLLAWAYAAWRDSVIEDYETDVQANVEVVTDKAESKADVELDRAVKQSVEQMEDDRREIENAKAENRSPLDALFD